MSAVFVTATGTEIGKTFVTAALIRELRRQGCAVSALKPIVSGFDERRAQESDPGILLTALGEAPTAAALDRIAPWRFRAPLSPDMAAGREGRHIDFSALIAFCTERIAQTDRMLLIEGVGGVMVPLDETHTVLDWIRALRCPALLVAGSYLGTISHTLTALDALRRSDIPIAALIVNETADSSVLLGETTATIARFAKGVSVCALPRLAAVEATHPTVAAIAKLIAP
jgi:dethiobiotin synthetase